MADPTNYAIHIEGVGDPESAKAKARNLAAELGADTAFFSTPEGRADLSKPATSKAMTPGGTEVEIVNPDHFTPIPTSYEPVAHQDAEGEWQIETEDRTYRKATPAEITAAGGKQ